MNDTLKHRFHFSIGELPYGYSIRSDICCEIIEHSMGLPYKQILTMFLYSIAFSPLLYDTSDEEPNDTLLNLGIVSDSVSQTTAV